MSLISPHQISHGTTECSDIGAMRRFLQEFLGLDVVRPLPEAQYMSKGGAWSVVCVGVNRPIKDQSPDNHFEIAVGTAAEVEEAHAKALALKGDYGIREVRPVVEGAGVRSFLLCDLDGGWWKISNLNQSMLDAAFAAGDVA